MPAIATYLIKLSVSLTAIFLFYQLVLRPLTFHVWNRWYLLGYTMLAFFIPFVDITPVLQENSWANKTVIQWVPLITGDAPAASVQLYPKFTVWNVCAL